MVNYQKELKALPGTLGPGTLGPETTADWLKVGKIVGDTANLASQPLYYNGAGRYVTAHDQLSYWEPSLIDKKVSEFGSKIRKSKHSRRSRHVSKIGKSKRSKHPRRSKSKQSKHKKQKNNRS